MPTLPTAAGAVTLLDIAKAMDPNGNIAATAELLSQTNEVLRTMPWIEGNLPTGHRTNIRTGLPPVIWRQMYQGVPASKSERAIVEDGCGILEARAEIDKDIADFNGNTAAFRTNENRAFLESMNQAMTTALFYGNAQINPEQFNGLAIRYNTRNTGSPISQNVIHGGGSGSDNTSIWLIVWGPNTVFGVYPKGSKAGLMHEDLGEGDAFDSTQRRFRAYMDRWQWKCGLVVADWRYAVRIANIDVSDLTALTGTQALTAATSIIKLMVDAHARIPNPGMGTPVFYCNRTVKAALAKLAMDRSQNAVNIQAAAEQFGSAGVAFAGQPTLTVLGTPVHTVDAILNTEAVVAA
jgi:hypothetical protein